MGLMIGVEFVEDRQSRTPDAKAMQHLASHAFDRGLIIIDCGPDGNVLRFIPPLITTTDELNWAIDLIDEGLESWETAQ
jgi:4-aminobutyrate aminotransferase-like enzyme